MDLYEGYTSTSVLHQGNEEELTKWSHKYFNKFIAPHLGDKKDIKILEIGCGYGRYTKAMLNLGYPHVVGIDISEEQIKYAKEKLNLKNVEVADAVTYLENNSATYDVVVLIDVMEHLELHYSITLQRKIYKALKPGGKFIIHVPNGLGPMSLSYHGDITHVRSYSVYSMSQSLRMGGFSRYNHYSLPPMVTGIKSLMRKLFWVFLVYPALKFYMLVSNGDDGGGIYTANLLTVASK